jgi:hypothetical protein
MQTEEDVLRNTDPGKKAWQLLIVHVALKMDINSIR